MPSDIGQRYRASMAGLSGRTSRTGIFAEADPHYAGSNAFYPKT